MHTNSLEEYLNIHSCSNEKPAALKRLGWFGTSWGEIPYNASSDGIGSCSVISSDLLRGPDREEDQV